MTAVKVHDHCPGCGVCTRPNVCPTDAISIVDGKAVIGPACIECGLCIPVCPIGVIVAVESTPPVIDEDVSEETSAEPPVSAAGEEDDHGETSTGP